MFTPGFRCSSLVCGASAVGSSAPALLAIDARDGAEIPLAYLTTIWFAA
jgi:hypothetical protein